MSTGTMLISMPKRIENATKPKPRRSEVIEVMAHRIIVRDTEARDKEAAKLTEREKALHAEVLKLGTPGEPKLNICSRAHRWDGTNGCSGYGNFQTINVTFDLSPHVTADLHHRLARLDDDRTKHRDKYNWLGRGRFKDEHLKVAKAKARTLLGAAVAPVSNVRVPAMLADEAVVKAFDSLIKKLENVDTDKAAIAV